MINTRTLIAVILAVGVSGSAAIASAATQSVLPIQDKTVHMGAVTGDVYYTVRPDGYHVVATFAERGTRPPVRFEAILAPGQSVTISTPRAVGQPADAVEITRQQDRLFVQKAAAIY
jgi:hypothetical protein